MNIIMLDGVERVVLDRAEYDELIDARDHARAMRDIAEGDVTLTEAEMDDYLASPTPLVYWRKRAGKTQSQLAADASVSQPYLAQMESGRRIGTVTVLGRVARSLGVRIEDLIAD